MMPLDRLGGWGWTAFLFSSPLLQAERLTTQMHCPSCQSGHIHRSKTRGIVESLLARFRLRPYRCEECDCRFFRRHANRKSKSASFGSPTGLTPAR
jgi:transposase-like protein